MNVPTRSEQDRLIPLNLLGKLRDRVTVAARQGELPLYRVDDQIMVRLSDVERLTGRPLDVAHPAPQCRPRKAGRNPYVSTAVTVDARNMLTNLAAETGMDRSAWLVPQLVARARRALCGRQLVERSAPEQFVTATYRADLTLRLDLPQRELLARAATACGLSLSAWTREVLLDASHP